MLLDTLLARFRSRGRLPEPPPDDHAEAAVYAAPSCACDPITPLAPNPPEASPRSEIVPKPPAPDRYPALSPAAVTSPRGGKLDALTAVLGRQKAGQALWAPNRLTAAERQQADQVLRRFR